MKDITYCTSTACPSKECRIKIANNSFQPGEIISMADFFGTCRFYIGWLVDKAQREEEPSKAKGKNVHATYYDVLYEEGGAGTT